ncbi:DNA replication/repair protein RecF [Paramagnetospirillum marisnigri]|uniref:DNA replication and repair protein RecF n=1 Tax=Paramagnetospirillum marisnigri TaxID=1285242 RepID=A0A178MXD4_9PROT|nr:DNA replication/repair protein RecF [Paramagnetospirillum marisnigri]OAN55299.1 DNA replication/repair protein RecF [Paramagnetospirillum marisnigri]
MAEAPDRLAVCRLSLVDFRCYARLRLDCDSRPVVLTGPNGAGKTNLLEALSFLAPGRGMRRAALGEVARHGSNPEGTWAVAAVLADGAEIGTGREVGSERRSVRLDGQTAKPGDLAGRVSALWLTPAMDRLFTEGASGRRRFLDRLTFGVFPGHAREAGAFEHAMRERNRLLKARRDGRGARGDGAWLAALEDGMARHGVAVAEARLTAVRLLDEACGRGIGPFPAARLAVEGEVEDWLAQGLAPSEAEAKLRESLTRARARDEAAGATTMGPHRSDLQVRHAARNLPVGQCSTGEQKAVLVAIVLAQVRVQRSSTGRAPLLLLDEIAAHLDDTRRAALYDELCALGVQSWMTGTDEPMFDGFGERAQFFRVADASVTPRARS